MKIIVFTIATSILTFIFAPESCKNEKQNNKDITIVEATLLKLAPPVEPSGVIARYRLAKYKVSKVCKGKLDEAEIVVDHFIVSGKEFDNVNLGDKVYLPVMKYKNLEPRYNSEELRTQTEKVETFYVGRFVFPAKSTNCAYDEKEILNLK